MCKKTSRAQKGNVTAGKGSPGESCRVITIPECKKDDPCCPASVDPLALQAGRLAFSRAPVTPCEAELAISVNIRPVSPRFNVSVLSAFSASMSASTAHSQGIVRTAGQNTEAE